MIQAGLIESIVQAFLQDKPRYELVSVEIDTDNRIVVELDSYNGVDVDICAQLSRFIECKLDRDKEDFELEVGSVSLTAPFKTRMQYEKNVGHEVEVLTAEGEKVTGELVEAAEDSFSVDVVTMEKVEGKKHKQRTVNTRTWAYNDVRQTRYLMKW